MGDRVGQQLGNYRLIRLLGQGGFADVYLAEHVHLGTQAAIKVLTTRLMSDEGETFRHEARTLAHLEHPHIVRVLDFGIEDGTPFLVMSYAPNGSLRSHHPKGTRLPLASIVPYVNQIAATLQYAHDQRLIHRDIKPENMLLGRNHEVLLSDFGLALLIQSSRYSNAQESAGTIAYMAPEQLQGHPGTASDQYALGIVVYEWLCGERPFRGSFPEIATQHTLVPPASLCEKVATIPSAVEQVVLKALAKDPKERFASVQSFALALEEASRENASGRTNLALSTEDSAKVGQISKSNLPIQLTPLIGREQEVASACVLLRRSNVRLATLTGTGGIGKTRLALQVATDLLADFADGVCFVSLAPISDPDLVAPAIVQALGLQETGQHSSLDLLKASLQDTHLLLLLDNFEQVVVAAPLLVELLQACPHLKVLVTSRTQLRIGGEHEFPVPPLAVPDLMHLPESDSLSQYAAVALFLQHAQALKPNFRLTVANASALAEICVRLDGLPLAIELAAARMKLLSPQALLARLDQRLQVLTSGSRDAPPRQQTLRNTIEWSYHLLDATEQQLFRRLSVFVGGCALEAVEALCAALDGEAGQVLDGVASLLEKNLLQQREQEGNEPRLLLLETIREFGLECLATYGEVQATRQAHATYYLLLTEAAQPHLNGAEQGHWFDRLEREHDNLRAALRWFIESEESEMALRLSDALSWFWMTRGHLREGRHWLQLALSRSEQAVTSMRARALYGAARLAFFQDDFVQGETLSEMALTFSRKLGDKQVIARSLRRLGELARMRHNFRAARPLLEESLAILRETDNKGNLAHTLYLLAPTLSQQGEYTRARLQVEESLALFKEVNDPRGRALALRFFAEALFFQGEYATAHAVGVEGLALARELGVKWHPASSLQLLGQLALHQHDAATAQSLLTESLERYREMGSRWSSAKVLAFLASIAAFQQDEAQAGALKEQSITILKEVEDQELLAAFLEELGVEVGVQGGPTWAARLWGAAENLREVIGVPFSLVEYPTYARAVSSACRHSGEQAFTTAWAQGRTMSLEQVLTAPAPTMFPSPTSAGSISAPLARKPAPYPDGLTAREVEVLRLVAGGLTDAQVAAQLVISPATVNTHLKAIYGKIGVSSRSAATRYTMEHKLM